MSSRLLQRLLVGSVQGNNIQRLWVPRLHTRVRCWKQRQVIHYGEGDKQTEDSSRTGSAGYRQVPVCSYARGKLLSSSASDVGTEVQQGRVSGKGNIGSNPGIDTKKTGL